MRRIIFQSKEDATAISVGKAANPLEVFVFPDLLVDPQSNGITRAYSKASAFDDPYTPVTTAIDIKAKYDAKCGAPSAGSPKVFFKYFYVNTATGEKSGEVMAQAKLA